MIVSAGKQVFLLSSHENGISKLSELDDPMSYFKDGEVSLFGITLKTQLKNQKKKNQSLKLKKISRKVVLFH